MITKYKLLTFNPLLDCMIMKAETMLPSSPLLHPQHQGWSIKLMYRF